MKYCRRCLYPENHPLGIVFDQEGVCSGCRVHEEKDEFLWDERAEKLEAIFDEFRTRKRVAYDCIIPVSGARDSYFIVHVVKNLYKMHPLLVTYNNQYNTPLGIRNLSYLRTIFGCDLISQNVSPPLAQKITRETLRLMGSMYWHCLAGGSVFPVHIAVKFKVPLIVWGAHQGCDQVGMFSHLDEVEMTRKYRKEHDLLGFEAEDLAAQSSNLRIEDLQLYKYPHDSEIAAVGVRGIYLNNYIRWDSKAQHEKMMDLYGYESAVQQRTFDTYSDVDSVHYSGIHDYIKFLKFGYGKVTDHACREIRLKRLTREEGIELVHRYQSVYPQDLPLLLQWLGMEESQFWENIDRFRDPLIWELNGRGVWQLRDCIMNHKKDDGVGVVRLDKNGYCDFRVSRGKYMNCENGGYILYGRGWNDE